jgi:ABC-2 type transport system ATP-binding protein
MSGNIVVEVNDLCKRYGTLDAVKNVSFSIPERTIFGLLGPNGAGKTSIMEMIEGIRIPTSGAIRVAGLDPVQHARQVKQIIGAQLQTTAMHDKIRIREILRLFASFYTSPRKVSDVLQLVGLAGKEERMYCNLSGGEKQRVALGMALIGDPKVVLLDEPTSGLDVGIRNQLHDLILRIRDEGKVVLMSTHYLEEAEKLCDQVGILQEGKLRAVASPKELIRMRKAEERVQVSFGSEVPVSILEALSGVSHARMENGRYVLAGPDASRIAASLTSHFEGSGVRVEEMRIVQAGLEDVYLELTTQLEAK